MYVENISKQTIVVENLRIANTFFTRFIGLMGKSYFEKGDGLWIKPCNSVHMFFMKFPLDVIFLDRDNKIIHMEEELQPWKISKLVYGGKSVLEIPSKTIKLSQCELNDRLLFRG